MGDHVTQEQLNFNMLKIHEQLRDSQRQADVRFTELAHHMENLADIMSRPHEQKLIQHSKQIDGLEKEVKDLNTHATKTKVYWSIFGSILLLVAGSVVKLFLE